MRTELVKENMSFQRLKASFKTLLEEKKENGGEDGGIVPEE